LKDISGVKTCQKSYIQQLLAKVYFKTQNFVSEVNDNQNLENLLGNKSQEKYDIITCLSVTKWIHLNYGDVGIKFLFHKVYQSLNTESESGGIFILEPQPWKSYKKKRELNDNVKDHFENIKFKPTDFHKYLMEVVGFKRSETLFVNGSSEEKKGFKRRPLVFYFNK